ncbi:hypothetical protein C6P40_001876 [Pichia californica]|uniref:AB hydrolase-1 domain-containing protein n=1 Tax=Pichia californica TaxID=460514 RepID=A0A9P7BEE4_9ASCO|nr:hypothetical protein C6P42_001950 [[Candida] californica]KAG0687781.1 hypothetical protein C6P40_001876 [[Candida] californica]
MLKIGRKVGICGIKFYSTKISEEKIKKPISKLKNVKTNLFESFKIWCEEMSNFDDRDKYSQDKFLKYMIPYYNHAELIEDKYKEFRAFNVKTKLKDDKDGQWYLNEIRIEKGNKLNTKHHLVMLHGYGASSVWFYKNYKEIIENSFKVKNLCIHGIDMIGFGLSGRPNIKFKHDKDTISELDIQTEGIKWDGKNGICIKCGGHLDGKINKDKHWCYCSDEEEDLRRGNIGFNEEKPNIIIKNSDICDYMKNQQELVNEVEDIYVETLEEWRKKQNIEKMDLLCHSFGGYMGFNYLLKYPNRVNNIMMVSPGGVERTPFAITNPKYKDIFKNNERDNKLKIKIENNVSSYGFLGRYGIIEEFFRILWRNKISIFMLLRLIGPFGPKLINDRNISKFTRSGSIKDEKEIKLFMRYIYSYCIRKSFSETSIMRVFDSSIVGKTPILDKIRDNKDLLKDKKILWVYGEHDFMYKECGYAAIKENEGRGECIIVSNAGHNVYMDNYEEFNRRAIKFFDY